MKSSSLSLTFGASPAEKEIFRLTPSADGEWLFQKQLASDSISE